MKCWLLAAGQPKYTETLAVAMKCGIEFLFEQLFYCQSSALQMKSRQTPEGYISKDIYIPYPIQISGKRIFPNPFFEWDMLKDIIS
jgi:hypothetical protein